jgi:hypothetical protein
MRTAPWCAGLILLITALPAAGATEVELATLCQPPASWANVSVPVDPADEARADCAFIGRRRAWVAVLSREADGRQRVVVVRTRNAGKTWRRSHLGRGEPTYTTSAGGPDVSLRFSNTDHGFLHVTDLPQHHNGHYRTDAWFESRNGGASFRRTRIRRKCAGPRGSCGAG